jgi:hypothetical protein
MNLEPMRDLRTELRAIVDRYFECETVPSEVAIACVTADLRHLADEKGADYAHADALGYSHYCEENRQDQAA